jgi:hypothetical protein
MGIKHHNIHTIQHFWSRKKNPLKSLYALKQAPKQWHKKWHEKFNEILISDGFSSIEVNKCVDIKSLDGEHVIMCLYVDDMFIFVTCIDIVIKTKSSASH